MTTRAGLVLAAALAAFCGCGSPAEPAAEGPVPALSRAGSRWQVTKGDRKVFSMTNEAGKIRWSKGAETDNPFVSGTVNDPKEDAKLKQIVHQSRHFRDLVQRLGRAGYGVASAEAASGG